MDIRVAWGACWTNLWGVEKFWQKRERRGRETVEETGNREERKKKRWKIVLTRRGGEGCVHIFYGRQIIGSYSSPQNYSEEKTHKKLILLMELRQSSAVESVPSPPQTTGEGAPPTPPERSPVGSPQPIRARAHSRSDSAGDSGVSATKRIGSSTNVTFFKTLGSFSNKNRITAKKNSTFAGGNRLTRKDSAGNVNARRSVSFDRSTFSKNASESTGGRLLVGKGLKRAKEIVVAIDELDEETHKVDDEVLQNISIVNPEKQLEDLAEEEGPEEDDNVCISIGHHKEKGTGIRRSSEVFIGGDGFFPLSQIKMPRPVYFTMNYDDFEDVKHLTDGSNSVIYKAKSGKMVSYHHAGSRIPPRIVLKVLSEQVQDARRAKREFDFERDILAALR